MEIKHNISFLPFYLQYIKNKNKNILLGSIASFMLLLLVNTSLRLENIPNGLTAILQEGKLSHFEGNEILEY